VELLRRRNRRIETLSIQYYPPLICRHVVGEFLYGQLLAEATPGALLEIQEFLASFECLEADETTSLVYARIRSALHKEGIKLPDPDYWIAAHALQHRLPLITTDTDFKCISDLQLHLVKM
jgi:predicted nucleic acid-binding protein